MDQWNNSTMVLSTFFLLCHSERREESPRPILVLSLLSSRLPTFGRNAGIQQFQQLVVTLNGCEGTPRPILFFSAITRTIVETHCNASLRRLHFGMTKSSKFCRNQDKFCHFIIHKTYPFSLLSPSILLAQILLLALV